MKSILRNIRITPKKLNVVAGAVRGKSVEEALTFLEFLPKKGARHLYSVINSAASNAENKDKLNRESLVVSELVVTKGRTLKRGLMGSRGRYKPMRKIMSHVFVKLS